MNINRTVLSGNLTADPELDRTASGVEVLRFRIAVNERWKNPQTGEWSDRANYIPCVLFGKRASNLSQLLAKGKKVIVAGRLHWSQWERDGRKRSAIEVIVDDLDLAFSRETSTARSMPAAPQEQEAPIMHDQDITF